jgi:hypothetical protein
LAAALQEHLTILFLRNMVCQLRLGSKMQKKLVGKLTFNVVFRYMGLVVPSMGEWKCDSFVKPTRS